MNLSSLHGVRVSMSAHFYVPRNELYNSYMYCGFFFVFFVFCFFLCVCVCVCVRVRVRVCACACACVCAPLVPHKFLRDYVFPLEKGIRKSKSTQHAKNNIRECASTRYQGQSAKLTQI